MGSVGGDEILLRRFYAFMRFSNIWFYDGETEGRFLAKVIAKYLICLYVLVGEIGNVVSLLQDEKSTYEEFVEGMYMMQSGTNLLFNSIGLMLSGKNSLKLFEELRNFDEFGVPDNLSFVDRTLHYVNTGFFAFCYGVPLLLQIGIALNTRECVAKNAEFGRNRLCGFMVVVVYPYDIDETPYYQFNLGMVTFHLIYLCSSGILFAIGACSAVEYIIVRIDDLKASLPRVFFEETFESRRERLITCIRYHIHIIKLSEDLNDCFSIILTPALFTYSVNIGLSLFNFLLSRSLTALCVFIGWISPVAAVCFCADRLVHKSVSIADAAYDTRWYRVETSLQKDLMFMIKRAQAPLILKSGKFGALSLPAFKQIMTGAYTYITMRSASSDDK